MNAGRLLTSKVAWRNVQLHTTERTDGLEPLAAARPAAEGLPPRQFQIGDKIIRDQAIEETGTQPSRPATTRHAAIKPSASMLTYPYRRCRTVAQSAWKLMRHKLFAKGSAPELTRWHAGSTQPGRRLPISIERRISEYHRRWIRMAFVKS